MPAASFFLGLRACHDASEGCPFTMTPRGGCRSSSWTGGAVGVSERCADSPAEAWRLLCKAAAVWKHPL